MGASIGGQFGGISKALNTNAEETKTCPNCRSVMDKSKRFCGDCGYDTLKTEDKKGQNSVICSQCKAEFQKTMKFCPECGKKYNPCPKCLADLENGAIVCPQCNYELPNSCPNCGGMLPDKNMRFCPECGKPLAKLCPSCNVQINGNPKFCPECGTKLD